MAAGKQAENRAVRAVDMRFPRSPGSAVDPLVLARYSPLALAGFS